MTSDTNCVENGDYLAWEDMEWVLHGEAKLETVEKEKSCGATSLLNFYKALFQAKTCMHHCQNLGTRVPSVGTFDEWSSLQAFLKEHVQFFSVLND